MRVTKIHHLVEELIYDDEIIPNTLLLKLLKILGEDLNDFVHEEEDLGGICVSLRKCEEIQVVVADVKVLSSRYQQNSQRAPEGGAAPFTGSRTVLFLKKRGHSVLACRWERRTFMPSSEKHGGTAELSSSASESKIGNFSTADMGMSPL